MKMRSKILCAGALAVSVLCVVGWGAASGNRLSFSTRAIRVTWNPLDFIEGSSEAVIASCPVTIEGSLHSNTITKTRDLLFGYVTRQDFGGCRVLANSMPWHLVYQSFTGTLPRLSGVRLGIVGMTLEFEFVGTCLYRTSLEAPLSGIANIEPGGTITGLTSDMTTAIPKTEGGVFCRPTIRHTNTGLLTQLGATTRVVVRLI